MEKRFLGNSGILVSKLCFGSLTLGPLQANLKLKDGASIIVEAFNNGINFLDTAEYYQNYKYIKEALKHINRNDFVITTKTYAYTKELAKKSVERALEEMGVDYIDIFLLHEQESIHTLNGHKEAYEYLLEQKEKGVIRAVGLSTHHIAGVLGGIEFGNIDVIHPMINYKGLGIVDGTIEEMLNAVKSAHDKGIGIYGMKAIGGGNLQNDVKTALDFVLDLDYVDSIAVGMKSIYEVSANVHYFENREFPFDLSDKLSNIPRKLLIEEYCTGCGACERRCNNNAIKIIGNKAVVDNSKCALCGYCSSVCKEFAIKII